MNSIVRNVTSAIVGLIVVLLMIMMMPNVKLQPYGIVLPLVKSTATYKPDQVKFYTDSNKPANYKVIGNISVQFHVAKPSVANDQILEQYAQMLAAKAGGNGIIVTFQEYVPSQIEAGLQKRIFIGQVIQRSGN